MIFYLSATGNTLWAARQIAERTGERLVSMAGVAGCARVYSLDEGERVGFCFPVHGWRPPLAVRNFVGDLEIRGFAGHYCYVLCTAGDNTGEAVDIMKKDLSRRGIVVHSAFSIIMPETYVGLPFMDVDKPEDEARKIARASEQLDVFIRQIQDRERGVEQVVRGRWPRINSRVIGALFVKKIITDKPFRVVGGRCTACGLCSKVCPAGDIIWEKGSKPRWKHDGSCMSCFACYHHCPARAIEYGRRTAHKGQYFFGRRRKGEGGGDGNPARGPVEEER